jgi:hypothetical protein
MKHEWRKKEKQWYLPKAKPEFVRIPSFNFITISGEGNPNSSHFQEYITALYSLSYGVKMSLKNEAKAPDNYEDYTVYPLEGVWDLNEKAKQNYSGELNKDDLVFKLMIRQPSFVSEAFFEKIREQTQIKKPHALLKKAKWESLNDGPCIQMLHIGSYDLEDETFEKMEVFSKENGFTREEKSHREIYLSDFRKVAADKLKTVLRFKVSE